MAVRRRCAGVTVVLTVGCALPAAWLWPVARELPPATAAWAGTVTWLAAVAGLVAVGGLWVTGLRGALDAWRGAPVPEAGIRRWVMLACGLGLGAGLLLHPAQAAAPGDPREATGPGAGFATALLDGLPMPDRPFGAVPAGRSAPGTRARSATARATGVDRVGVRVGDCLWSLAARDLPPRAGPGRVAARTRALHALNRDRIGPDPDLLLPGTELRLPPPGPSGRPGTEGPGSSSPRGPSVSASVEEEP